MVVSTALLINKLKRVFPDGFQISYKMGMLNTTKAIYFRNSKVYLFNMEDNFLFTEQFGYSETEFLKTYKGCLWKLEMTIS
ncbi:MAG: hypothetical protein NVSMB24_11190 [Mucilaginibacter sp.]